VQFGTKLHVGRARNRDRFSAPISGTFVIGMRLGLLQYYRVGQKVIRRITIEETFTRSQTFDGQNAMAEQRRSVLAVDSYP